MKKMNEYRINEIFYSLQGEGHNTGRAAVFVRFAGCNLACSFCDTDFAHYERLTADDILAHILKAAHATPGTTVESHPDATLPLIVLTGGEPTLQADEPLVDTLHKAGYEVAMESNGTHMPPRNIDWLTISPKQAVVVKRCNELKCIFTEPARVSDFDIKADHYYLQPCDTGDKAQNQAIIDQCVDYIKQHPRWQLSLQTHKLVGFK